MAGGGEGGRKWKFGGLCGRVPVAIRGPLPGFTYVF